MTINDATRRQIGASDPTVSTWVSANAGSGKTRVLTDRVARLLFQGVPPQRILCLTYTKAAANEMQIRLFNRLGGWAMRTDDALRAELAEMGESWPLGAQDLRRARQMFATAIETPGGLKIQTIHSFCASVLRRFPLEAGVSPNFREIDDRAAKRLRQDVVDAMASDDRRGLVDAVANQATDGFDPLSKNIVASADTIARAGDRAAAFDEFGLEPDAGPDNLARVCAFSQEHAEAVTALARAPFEAATDIKYASKLAPLAGRALNVQDLPVLEDVFLTKSGNVPFSAKLGSVPTAKGKPLVAAHLAQIDELAALIEGARKLRISIAAAERTWAFQAFAAAFLQDYRARKSRAGWLDFDDLILKTRDLLSDPRVAEWVLFRLDGGIDHILVDEAQDTSPAQWQVIELLAQEFTSGLGARTDAHRTIFVVGDRKQSIYSFQGAAPDAFDAMRGAFGEKLAQIGQKLAHVDLRHSFRSAPAILQYVDQTLRPIASTGLGGHLDHLAFHSDRPGRVDLWPNIEPPPKDDADFEWSRPVDQTLPSDPAVRLADEIAGQIGQLLDGCQAIISNQGPRPIRAGDFLILVQRRSGTLFAQLLRALKAAGLPVAGADLLSLDVELAVKDIRSLLAFLALPRDDLALAEALKSPLFGWTESDLYDLAQPRAANSSLWRALRDARPIGDSTRDMIDALRNFADFLRPYELIDRILTRHCGRKKLLARLGPEAEEGIDALLGLALTYELTEVPSLTGFLTWLDVEEVKIKRQTDSASDLIRVMTVHGAKGLEAPIVILPDTRSHRRQTGGSDLLSDKQGIMWKPLKSEMPPRAVAAQEARETRDKEERLRLLYVAMTRAESWLILCGAGKAGAESWYSIMQDGMNALGAARFDSPVGEGLRFALGDWPRPVQGKPKRGAEVETIPRWATTRPPQPVRPQTTLSPSGLGGAKALTGDDGQDRGLAMARGSALHLLLEHLPGLEPAVWEDRARGLVGDRDDLAALLGEARAVIQSEALAHIFSPSALCEVDLTANLPELDGRRVRGAVDRLVIEDERILAVDFKTNAAVPDTAEEVPEGYLRQMGAYLGALEAIFPDRLVNVAILWTRTGQLMPFEHEIVKAALRDAPLS